MVSRRFEAGESPIRFATALRAVPCPRPYPRCRRALFFGAAEKALEALTLVGGGVHTVIMDLEDVPAIDATGLVALETTIQRLNSQSAKVVLSGVRPQPRRALEKAGFEQRAGPLEITDDTTVTLDRFIG